MVKSSTGLLVLHGLRLRGFVGASDLADHLGLASAEVAALLDLAGQDGFAQFRNGTRPGWSLTSEGRKEGERLLAEELDAAGLRTAMTTTYRTFLPVNRLLLASCTRWQVKDVENQILNDHDDPAYDDAVIAELAEIDAAIQPICAELGHRLSRFGGYGPRLQFALERLLAGDGDWFTKPTIDSYHTVWFELHEDLLATLGIDRVSEQAPKRED